MISNSKIVFYFLVNSKSFFGIFSVYHFKKQQQHKQRDSWREEPQHKQRKTNVKECKTNESTE